MAIGASGGKDSTVLAYIMKTLNERYNYGLKLVLLSIGNIVKRSIYIHTTGSLRMSFGYNSGTLLIPGAARQYPLAPRPRFGGFDRVS